jgi:hypothetical protein
MTEAPYTPPQPSTTPDPKDELREAFTHLKRAAGLVLGQASKDPALKYARDGAVEAIRKLGETAEPVAKQAFTVTSAAASEASRALFDVAGKLSERLSSRPGAAPTSAPASTRETASSPNDGAASDPD